MVERTLHYVLPDMSCKVLSSSRTDAMVSANNIAVALMTASPLPDTFLADFNQNLPQDIRARSIDHSDPKTFNIIQASKEKEYLYLFSHGLKAHPFAAPLLTSFSEHLDIQLMQEGAAMFTGTHEFYNFCYKPSENTQYKRTITCSHIKENTYYTANFFPETTYVYCIKGSGFLRHQIRIMMGVLYKLGKGDYTINDVASLLEGPRLPFWQLPLAPASGLILQSTSFE